VQDGRIHIEKINGPFLYRGRRLAGRIRHRHEASDRARLAVAARVRDLSEIHGCGSGAVRLTLTANPKRRFSMPKVDGVAWMSQRHDLWFARMMIN
jgi:hypothetical protein